MSAHLLPPELWLEIFDWATHSTLLRYDNHMSFDRVPDGARDVSLPIKIAISAVCRTWHSWIAQSMYKDVAISHGAHALQSILEGDKQTGICYGEMVRRVVLPYRSTVSVPSRPLQSIAILKACKHIHTLLRPQHSVFNGLRFEFDSENVDLPSLQRLEWWHHGEAEQTGGINSLGHVLRSAPNISYLFIGGVIGSSLICREQQPIVLAHLETLRLNIRSGTLFYRILFQWSMPILNHIIMDSIPVTEGLEAIWDVLGGQLEIVELGRHIRFLMNDILTSCLRGCPTLKRLNYYLFFTATPTSEDDLVHLGIAEIGLHAHINAMLADGGSVWSLIEKHFEFICGPTFPELRKLTLHGDWGAITSHKLFEPIQERLRDMEKLEVTFDGW